ncbi:MAG: hypothetical protein ASARMPREDX12_005669, partial [Alectoria sarmentosa]
MSNIVRARLIDAYVKDPKWAKIIKVLDDKASMEKKFDGEVAELPFVRREAGLIFHVDKFTGLERLCIPQPLVKARVRQ